MNGRNLSALCILNWEKFVFLSNTSIYIVYELQGIFDFAKWSKITYYHTSVRVHWECVTLIRLYNTVVPLKTTQKWKWFFCLHWECSLFVFTAMSCCSCMPYTKIWTNDETHAAQALQRNFWFQLKVKQCKWSNVERNYNISGGIVVCVSGWLVAIHMHRLKYHTSKIIFIQHADRDWWPYAKSSIVWIKRQ